MDYKQTKNVLLKLLELANKADTEQALTWQKPKDACQNGGFYGHLKNALLSIGGEYAYNYWIETGEFPS